MKHLFIHIPKSAGMSIRHGLKDQIVQARPDMHKSPEYTKAVREHMAKRNEHHGFEHARWRDLSEEAHKLPAFAIIRNPWARVASRYFFGRFVATQTHKAESKNYTFGSFDEFLEERHRWGDEPFYWHRATRGWYPALDYVSDESGNMRCTLLRCEHLAEDLLHYMGAVLPPRRRNVTINTWVYQECYTEAQKRIVADWYALDIEWWGFTFDSAATRNVMACGA